VINSQIRASYWMTFPLIIVNFNHFFIQPTPGKQPYIKSVSENSRQRHDSAATRKFVTKYLRRNFSTPCRKFLLSHTLEYHIIYFELWQFMEDSCKKVVYNDVLTVLVYYRGDELRLFSAYHAVLTVL
jgi:hypothetical protein